MSQQLVTNELRKKWTPVLEAETNTVRGLSQDDIGIRLLENQEQWNTKNLGNYEGDYITESEAAGSVQSHIGRFQPVLIAMAKRMGINEVGMEFFGYQPMNGPDGQIFAMRARQGGQRADANALTGNMSNPQNRDELLFNEAPANFSGSSANAALADLGDPSGFSAAQLADPSTGGDTANIAGSLGMDTATAESLGTRGGAAWGRVGVTIQKATVTARSRGLYADYSHELRQDMANVHGEDVDSILSDVLVTEINAEQSREFIRIMNRSARHATGHGTNGIVNMTTEVSGRWAVEKWKYLLFVLEVEANIVAMQTRRGKANKVLCAPNVASALTMAGLLDYTTAVSSQAKMKVDPTGRTYAGKLSNGMDCYIDPYASSINYITLAYKGANQLDAGVFFAPYVPLEMYKANGEDSFQPRMAFKTRYGVVANPFVQIPANQAVNTAVTDAGLGAQTWVAEANGVAAHYDEATGNPYFRKLALLNLF